MVVAGDTFRAGAVEQLETWGEKIGVKVVSSTLNADPSLELPYAKSMLH